MPTQTTVPATTDTAASVVPPILLSATPTGTASDMSIALDFNTAMAAANGTIIVTDGAVQTVIDRETGQPTVRVVGATDTHTLSASSLVIEGTHVKLDVTGLLAGHTYSVVMGADVLQSSGHVAFGGLRSTSQLTFTTPAAPDTKGPALVSVDTNGAVLKAGGSIAVTLTFSKAVANLTADALSAPHASISGVTTNDGGLTWHATLKAPADATTAAGNVLGLDMGKVLDAAGNHGSGISNLASYAVDTQAPTATVALDATLLATGHDAVATIRFSEAVTGFTAAALSAGHATVSNLYTTDDGTTWLATLSGNGATTAGGNVLAVDLGQVRDLAGNAGSGSAASAAYTVDTQGPSTVTIALDGAMLANAKALHATFTFAEAVKDLPLAALNTPHALVSGIATGDGGKTWTATLTPDGSGTWTGNAIGVDLTKVVDLAGNAGSGSIVSAPYTVDTQGPTATVALGGAAMHTGSSLGLTLHFSEAVTDLTAAALQAPNAALANLQHSADYLTWTATLTPQAGVTVTSNTISLDLTKVHDAAGNAGTGSAFSGNYAVDTQGPSAVTIALDGAALGGGNSIHATFTFAESVRDLPLAAISAPHAHVAGIATQDGGKTWTATLTADGSGTWTGNAVGVDLTRVADLAGNTGSGSAMSAMYAVDTQGPGATLALNGSGLTVQFNEAVTDLTAAALQAPNATLANLQHSADYLTWTATLTPLTASGGNAVSLDLAKVHDAFGNAGSGTITAGAAAPADTTPPTVADILFDGTTLGPTHSVAFTITFSESVTGLTTAALQAPHAKVSGLATIDGGKTWTGILTVADGATSSKNNVLGVDLTQVHDAAGNAGAGTATSLSHYDVNTDALTASVSLDGTALVSGGTVGVTIRFSAPVTTLDAGVLNTPHATLGDLHHSDDNLTWYATLSAADAGTLAGTNAVSVDLTKVHDTLGNAGSGTASSGNYTFDTTVAAYVSEIGISEGSDNGPYDHDGITNIGNPTAAGYFFGTLTTSQHLQVTLDGQPVNATGTTFGTPVGSLTAWTYGSEGYLSAGTHTYAASIVDDTGHASVTVSKQFTIDMTAPHLTGSPNGATAFDTTGNLVLTFDKAVYWKNTDNKYYGLQFHNDDGGTTYVNLADGDFSSDHKTVTLTPAELHLGTGNGYTLTLSSSLTDLAGNMVAERSIGFHTAGPYVDVTPPSATALTTPVAAGYVGIGSTVEMRVAFSEAVNVVGAPVLLLNNGAKATFQNLSDDHRTAVFAYTVAAGDQDIAGLNITDKSGLVGHFTDGAGHLLDAEHITFGYLGNTLGYPVTINVDAHAPGAPGKPVLDASSDTGVSATDGITMDKTPTLTGTAAEAGGKIEVYEGDTLLGSANVGTDLAWTFTLDDAKAFADGVHTLTVRQVDAAGNRSAPSASLAITIDTAAPTVTLDKSYTKSSANWHSLEFSEKIVFATNGTIDVLDSSNNGKSHHAWNAMTNWDITTNAQGVQNTLELNLGTLVGFYHMIENSNAVQDVAGNVAIIGSSDFYVGPSL